MRGNSLSPNFYAYLILIAMSVLAAKVLLMIHIKNLDVLQLSAQGVLSGTPSYSAFQNRLLGPFLTDFFMRIGLPYQSAWFLFNKLGLLAFSFYLYAVLRRMHLSFEVALLWVCSALFLFLSMQHFWFYPWDTLDLLIFTVFVGGMLSNRPGKFFLVLFVVAILNRESALFIALYLMIRATEIDAWRIKVKDLKALLLSALLLVLGILWTISIRGYLFVSRPDGGPDFEADIYGNQIKLFSNFIDLFGMKYGIDVFFIFLFLVGYIYFFFEKYNSLSLSMQRCLLVMTFMLLNTVIFGVLGETRMYISFIPFLVLMVNSFRKNEIGRSTY